MLKCKNEFKDGCKLFVEAKDYNLHYPSSTHSKLTIFFKCLSLRSTEEAKASMSA